MLQKLWEIFIAFLKPGLLGFGGGQATIPLIEAEVVDLKGWLTPEQFNDFYAIGNTLPGPIATKMSIIIGYDLMGPVGAFVALVGLLLPSTIAIIVIYKLFMANMDKDFVKGMQAAAKPVVAVLIAGVAFGIARSSVFVDLDFTSSKTLLIMGIFVVSAVLMLLNEYKVLYVHPAYITLGALLVGAFFIR